jgi:SAM-dependent methyltransferase
MTNVFASRAAYFYQVLQNGTCVVNADITKAIVAATQSLLPHSHALEIGMGSGSLAALLLAKNPAIQTYYGLEPAEEMRAYMSASLEANPRFQLVTDPFQKAELLPVDLIVTRFTLHDLANELPHWYARIFSLLKPGGIFINHDVCHGETSADTEICIEYLIRIIRRIPAETPEDEIARDQLIEHFQSEVAYYLTPQAHADLLTAAGMKVDSITFNGGTTYLLQAHRPF